MGRTLSLSSRHIGKKARFWIETALILFCLLLIGSLYFYKLGDIPAGLYNDEASIGVNARSILESGKDEHGMSWPIYFQAFGEYKNPLFIYATSAFFGIAGVSEWTLRSVAVVFGLLTIMIVYLLGKDIGKSRLLGTATALLLAILPWHFEINRIGFEVASSLFFLVTAIYGLYRWTEKDKIAWLILGNLAMGLFLYSYTTARLFSPLFLLLFVMLNYQVLWQRRKTAWIGILVYLVTILPFCLFLWQHPDFNQRFNSISIFQDKEPWFSFLKNYFAYFSGEFLFLRGDLNIRHHVHLYGTGEIYLGMIPLILAGLVGIVRSKRNSFHLFWLSLLILFPLAGSMTNEGVPHALRGYIGVLLFAVLGGFGIKTLWVSSRKFLRSVAGGMVVAGIFCIPVLVQAHLFFTHYFNSYPMYASYSPGAWQKEEGEINRFILEHYRPGTTGAIIETGSGRQEIDIFHKFYLPQEIREKIRFINESDMSRLIPGTILILSGSEAAYLNLPPPLQKIVTHENQTLFSLYAL